MKQRLNSLSLGDDVNQMKGTHDCLTRVHPTCVALTLNPSPNSGRGTLNLAPLLPKLGEGAGG
jgi:hypothetical protein